jgi:ribosomal protein S3AE
MREEFAKEMKKTTYEKLIQGVLQSRLQKDLKKRLSKIIPLRSLEIRHLELLKKASPKPKKEVKEEASEKKEMPKKEE